MAAEAGDGNGGKKSAFRWLDVVRYTVAAVVTVVIAAVVVKAITVVFRPDSLTLSVINNSVFITGQRSPQPQGAMSLRFTLRAMNPSGRVRLYYFNITAGAPNINVSLFDNRTDAWMAAPDVSSIIYVLPPSFAVPPLQYVDTFYLADFTKDDMMAPYFDILSRGGKISDVTMRVDGYLVTEELGRNSTPARTTYYCKQLVVGLSPDETPSENTQEAGCTTYL